MILTIDGKSAGTCQIASWQDEEPSMVGISIDPIHRGKGHGTVLMLAAIELARSAGKASLSLTVEKENTSAIDLYRRLGFTVTMDDGIQLWMAVALPQEPRTP
jgi:ribosomal protein S18 acetylase RimI-like enzyme